MTRASTRAQVVHWEKTLERLRVGGWPEVLSRVDRTILATRAGVVLPDEDDMTLVKAAEHLATAGHLRIPADWQNYADAEAYKRG